MVKITSITAREILDSRGNPTVETTVVLEDGSSGVAGVPSGVSTGSHEAVELRDNDPKRYGGKGVLTAVNHVNTSIAQKLTGLEITDQPTIDQALISLDGTENKSKLGANSILSVSLASAIACAKSRKMSLYSYIAEIGNQAFPGQLSARMPTPLFNILNGGKHGGGNLDFQEFFLIPSATTFAKSLQIGTEIYQELKKLLIAQKQTHAVGDEGGFGPNLKTNAEGLELFIQTIIKTPYTIGIDVFFGLDMAANSFYLDGRYTLIDQPNSLTTDQYVDYVRTIQKKYSLILLEDPLPEDDWGEWSKLTKLMPDTIIVGDDLLVTNSLRLKRAIEEKSCTGIIIKLNQIGTLTEAIQVFQQAKSAGIKTIVSHRSGETTDTYLADVAVGLGADFVKFGAPARGERVAKYNRLLAIEVELHEDRNASIL